MCHSESLSVLFVHVSLILGLTAGLTGLRPGVKSGNPQGASLAAAVREGWKTRGPQVRVQAVVMRFFGLFAFFFIDLPSCGR